MGVLQMKFPYVLWKPRANDTGVRFVTLEDLPGSGLRSVYQFSETDASAMHDLDSFKSFKGTVYSEELLIDTDTEAASEACEGRLKALGLGFKKFTTGNRGHHYHVKRSGVASHTLPSSDRVFVEREFPLADRSFYHHVGLYRCIGATHAKTGKKKELLYEVPGKVLELVPEAPKALEAVSSSVEVGNSSVFADETLRRFTIPYGPGERHQGMINVALCLDRLQQPYDFALGYLWNVNLLSNDPIELKDVARILDWAYYKRDKAGKL